MYLFNLSINTGIFPFILNISKVIVIYKKHNRCYYTNYRPISMTSQFTNIFKKLIKIRILHFLNKNKILKTCQFGFREYTSTCNARIDFTGYLQTNNDKHCAVVSIDIKKAFDSLDNFILIEKLYLYGFRGLSGDFIRSYLKREINTLPIKYGIPQGSLLGPILFLLFINDLSNILVILNFLQMIQLLPSLIKIFQTLKILLMTL